MTNTLILALLPILGIIISLFARSGGIQAIRGVLTHNMAAVSGVTMLLAIDVAGGSSFASLGQEQSTTVSFTTDKADATTKDSVNWEENISTIRHVALTSSGILDETDTAWGKLLTAWFTTAGPLQIEARITTPGATTFIGQAHIDSLDYEGNHDGTLNYSLSLSGNGAFVKA